MSSYKDRSNPSQAPPLLLAFLSLYLITNTCFASSHWQEALALKNLAVGPSPQITCPENAIALPTSQDPQTIIDTHPNGTVFCLKSGIHRMRTLQLGPGDQLIGEFGSILKGSRILSNWRPSGNMWVADGQTQQGPGSNKQCEAGYYCTRPEQLFVDGVLLRHVGQIQNVVGNETWYFDYAQNAIYLGFDPRNHMIETSITPEAILGAEGSIVRNIKIEHYSTPSLNGSSVAAVKVHIGGTLEDCEISSNAGAGVFARSNATIRRNSISANGRLGISAWQAGGTVIRENRLDSNNTKRFSLMGSDAGSGGIKVTSTNGIQVSSNWVSQNVGNGVWIDRNSSNVLLDGNLVEDNVRNGLYFEISSAGEIVGNLCRRNLAGIIVSNSQNVSVHSNRVEDNTTGIVALLVCRGIENPLQNVTIYENEIEQQAGTDPTLGEVYNRAAGLWVRASCTEYWAYPFDSWFETRGNWFRDNAYWLRPGAEPLFLWTSGANKISKMDHLSWQAAGNDLDGYFHLSDSSELLLETFESGDFSSWR